MEQLKISDNTKNKNNTQGEKSPKKKGIFPRNKSKNILEI